MSQAGGLGWRLTTGLPQNLPGRSRFGQTARPTRLPHFPKASTHSHPKASTHSHKTDTLRHVCRRTHLLRVLGTGSPYGNDLRFNRRNSETFFLEALQHMITSDPLTFERLTA